MSCDLCLPAITRQGSFLRGNSASWEGSRGGLPSSPALGHQALSLETHPSFQTSGLTSREPGSGGTAAGQHGVPRCVPLHPPALTPPAQVGSLSLGGQASCGTRPGPLCHHSLALPRPSVELSPGLPRLK